MKRYIIALCILLCFVAGCTPKAAEQPAASDVNTQNTQDVQDTQNAQDVQDVQDTPDTQDTQPQSLEDLTANAIQATITMEDGGEIVLELYPDLAPQSVRNFVYLANQGFYDGLKFHRIMKDFMIQGGDPDGTGGGGPGYHIKGEFEKNNFTNDLKHTRGVLSMARSNSFDSAGSQFFIMHADSPSLDGLYAAFGKVSSGMDVVDKIADTPNSGANGAVAEENKPVIKSITIDDDVELPEPDMLK